MADIFDTPHNRRLVLKYCLFLAIVTFKIANSIVRNVAKQTIIDEFKVVFSVLNCAENSWITSGILVLASIAIFSVPSGKVL
jgi:hypothetical protein